MPYEHAETEKGMRLRLCASSMQQTTTSPERCKMCQMHTVWVDICSVHFCVVTGGALPTCRGAFGGRGAGLMLDQWKTPRLKNFLAQTCRNLTGLI
eukprot:6441869-Amphidinium_carterae.1